jgi:AraC family transcriptional regulator of arabinose operon
MERAARWKCRCVAGPSASIFQPIDSRAVPAVTTVSRATPRPDVLVVRRVIRPGEPRVPHVAATGHWELIYTLSGSETARLPGALVVMDAHSVVVFRNDARGRSVGGGGGSSAEWRALHACFDPGPRWSPPAPLERVGDDVYRSRITRTAIQQRIQDAFGRLLVDASERVAATALEAADRRHVLRGGGDDLQRELMFVTLREILLLASKAREGGAPVDARIRDALDAMARDLVATHTLRSLARASRLSPSRFAHLFRSEVGAPPLRVLRLMRLRQAKLQLLYTEDTVERIAESTGFTSSSHLGREFRREFGLSPRSYRANAGL